MRRRREGQESATSWFQDPEGLGGCSAKRQDQKEWQKEERKDKDDSSGAAIDASEFVPGEAK
jgi:hypothetical protein